MKKNRLLIAAGVLVVLLALTVWKLGQDESQQFATAEVEADLPEVWPEPPPVVLESLRTHTTYDDLAANLPDVPLISGLGSPVISPTVARHLSPYPPISAIRRAIHST